jgi:NAD(P)-dependent dehydrogenase (short-subunit alcohol dehydrogenase family)
MDLYGKIAVITGAGRGIGRAIALRLAGAGAKVAVADLLIENANLVTNEICAQGRQAIAIPVDVSQADLVNRMMTTVLAEFGGIDILINNAGIFKAEPFDEMTEDQWDRMIAVHLKGCFLCCRAAVPHMLERNSGCIINIASTSGITGGTSGAHYAAAKGGIVALTRSLGRELAGRGIRVNAVAPSKIETDMLQAGTPEARVALIKKIPLGRVGKAEEIANVVAFLASEEASYITGEVIVASGGYL